MPTVTELSMLTINEVESQEVYDEMLANGLVNDNELYLVKGGGNENYDWDNRYYTEAEVDAKFSELDDAVLLQSFPEPEVPSVKLTNIISSNGKFVASGIDSDNNHCVVYSEDGLTWEKFLLPSQTVSQFGTSGNGTFIFRQNNGASSKLIISTDGKNWELEENAPLGLYNMTYGNGKFVATKGTSIFYSVDTITWTEVVIDFTASKIVWGNDKFVTCASSDVTQIGYSSDGITWNTITLSETIPMVSNIIYGNGMFILVTRENNNYYYSTDGITWEVGTWPTAQFYLVSTFAMNKFIVIPSHYTVENRGFGYYSTDGLNWIKFEFDNSLRVEGVAFENNMGVAVNYYTLTNPIFYSYDGLNWTCGGDEAIKQNNEIVTAKLVNKVVSSKKVAPMYTYDISEYTAGTTALTTGKLYLRYE